MTEITHEDVKAFMNEPDPVPEEKAPEPMGLDDWESPEPVRDNKLTTEEIARLAHRSLLYFESHLNGSSMLMFPWDELQDDERKHWISKANYFIQTAGNPNGHEECMKMHDVMLEAMLRDGWRYGETYSEDEKTSERLLPYRALPPHERTKDFLFRSVVISLLQVWKGY